MINGFVLLFAPGGEMITQYSLNKYPEILLCACFIWIAGPIYIGNTSFYNQPISLFKKIVQKLL